MAMDLWNIPVARTVDPSTSHEAEADLNASGRRTRQIVLIKMALASGPKTSDELSRVALKYTSRISDLRKLGYDITARRVGGSYVYTMAGATGGAQ